MTNSVRIANDDLEARRMARGLLHTAAGQSAAVGAAVRGMISDATGATR